MRRLTATLTAAIAIAALSTLVAPAAPVQSTGSPAVEVRDRSLERSVPGTVWFQGYLAEVSTGDPVSGQVDITAQLFDQAEDGSSLWGPETHESVVVSNGWFQIELGSVVAPLPSFDTPPYYLELTVAGEALAPRQKLGSVPTALRADATDEGVPGTDEQVIYNDGGVLAGSDITYNNENGCVGIGDTNPSERLSIFDDQNRTTLRLESSMADGNFTMLYLYRTEPMTLSDDIVEIRVPETSNPSASLIRCAVGTTQKFTLDASGELYVGGETDVRSDEGYALVAQTYDTSMATAIRGISDSEDLFGIGVTGECISVDGSGFGAYFQGGYCGMQGFSSVSDSSTNYAVTALINSSTGNSYGVRSDVSGTGTNYAFYGTANGGSTNWAGYFAGDVRVTGTLNPTRGGFEIDHPLDPEGRYLRHAFVHSSEMKTVYDGVVVLGAGGRAEVLLPDWFEPLNTDYRYQLTAVGAAAPELHIEQEITGGRFTIAGGSPSMKVCWQVTGVRRDAVAKTHPLQVEGTKRPKDIGRYIAPEAYGASRNMLIGYEEVRSPSTVDR